MKTIPRTGGLVGGADNPTTGGSVAISWVLIWFAADLIDLGLCSGNGYALSCGCCEWCIS